MFHIIGELLVGWLIADLSSGLAHWWEDRVGDENMPLLGEHVIRGNRRHHRDPLAFLDNSFIGRNQAAWAVAFTISMGWLWVTGPNLMWASASLGGLLAAEVHAWTHRPPNRFVRVLQEIGLLQSPGHHAGHHRAPNDRRYCGLTNWCNPILDALGFWESLESGLDRIGLTPNRGLA